MTDIKLNNSTLATASGSTISWGSGVPAGSIIEQFLSPCDGSSLTVQSGTYTVQSVTAVQNITVTFTDITGSEISYTPPSNAKTVIYSFSFQMAPIDEYSANNYSLYIDDTEVTNARTSFGCDTYLSAQAKFMWPFHIGGSANAATGRTATWTSSKTIKMKTRCYSTSHESKLHMVDHWEGSGTDQFSMPIIGITALA